ncbi:MAG: hypothetical protein JWP97_5171 [Labilithrix sp.]|nr:hypothetical protein [Labilithrix sp.]
MFSRAASSICLAFTLVVSACSSSSSPSTAPAAAGNGVDDVKQSCELRVAWQRRGERTCSDCLAAAPGPSCDCEQFREFGGKCAAQGEAEQAEPTCTFDISKCVSACAAGDCACADGCYAQAPACKPKAAARAGCVTEVCSPYCK